MLYLIIYYVNLNYGIGYSVLNLCNFVIDVVNVVKGSINFLKYDNDGDGIVEMFVIIYVGMVKLICSFLLFW